MAKERAVSEGVPFYVFDKVVKETEKAILVNIEGRDIWVPKSQILENSEVTEAGDDGTIVLSTWFCEKEGLG